MMKMPFAMDRRGYLGAIVVLLSILFSYWQTLDALTTQWLNNEDFSHGLLIVPISAWLIWRKREEIGRLPIASDWRGIGLFFGAAGLYVVGELGAELFTIRVSMLLFVIASVWTFFGLSLMRCIAFPLAFLFLMLPLPGFIYRNMTFPLQLISSKWSVVLLQWLGVMAYREGNVIDIGFTQLQVVEACNGLRFILPLFTMGVLFSYWESKSWWKRLVLIGATIPIAVLSNVVRIAGTGIISLYWGAKAAEGFFHSFSGWVIFMGCFGVFLLLNQLLGHIGKEEILPLSSGSATGGAGREPKKIKIRLLPQLLGVAIVLLTPPLVEFLGHVPPVPLKKSLDEFPLSLSGWTGRQTRMPSEIWSQVGGQAYVMVEYNKEGYSPMEFYAAYYESQRKAGDFIHSPKLCLPGAGWFIENNGVRRLKFSGSSPGFGSELAFNELVINKNGFRQMVYYWYQGRGRNFTNEFMAKFYMVWDGIWRRRTDGALVRLVMPVTPDLKISDCRNQLDNFALTVSKELNVYLP